MWRAIRLGDVANKIVCLRLGGSGGVEGREWMSRVIERWYEAAWAPCLQLMLLSGTQALGSCMS